MKKIFWLWFSVCFISGIAACWIPWGEPDGFHGQGFPVPIVCWDKDLNGQFLPYESFWGLLLNPIAYGIAGSTIWLLVWFLVWLVRRLLIFCRVRVA
jgi:hypothetical protein